VSWFIKETCSGSGLQLININITINSGGTLNYTIYFITLAASKKQMKILRVLVLILSTWFHVKFMAGKSAVNALSIN